MKHIFVIDTNLIDAIADALCVKHDTPTGTAKSLMLMLKLIFAFLYSSGTDNTFHRISNYIISISYNTFRTVFCTAPPFQPGSATNQTD